jgi:hypothetical protein
MGIKKEKKRNNKKHTHKVQEPQFSLLIKVLELFLRCLILVLVFKPKL